MADYKTMYLTMFHAAEEALVLLVGCCGDMDRLQKVVNILSAAKRDGKSRLFFAPFVALKRATGVPLAHKGRGDSAVESPT